MIINNTNIEIRKTRIDKVAKFSTLGLSCLIGGIFLAIIIFILFKGVPSLAKIFSSSTWDFVDNYGVLPLFIGTIFVTFIAVIIALPLSLFTALTIYEFFPKKMKAVFNFLVEMLAGIPSVIFGFFGIAFFINSGLLKSSIFLAGLILAFMIIPNMIYFINISLNSLNKAYKSSSLALGASRTETIFKAIIPAIKPGIIAGLSIGLARAIGETIAVTMIIGNTPILPNKHDFFTKFFSMFLFHSSQTISSTIATLFLEANNAQISILYALSIILFLTVTIFNVFAILYVDNKLKIKRKKRFYKRRRK